MRSRSPLQHRKERALADTLTRYDLVTAAKGGRWELKTGGKSVGWFETKEAALDLPADCKEFSTPCQAARARCASTPR